ncbi:MAG: SDR family NAD(P)-dependent oxidoreductase [Bradymonadia bacterium]
MNPQKKVAVITGASSGIGKATAMHLAERGYRLCLTARRESHLEALAHTLGATTEVLIQPADIRNGTELGFVFDRVVQEWGTLDVLVNSAGLGRVAPLISGDVNHWKEMFDVNVIGLSVATQHAIRVMRDTTDRGLIIHISSMSGHRVPEGTGSMYSATKHAVKALTEGLRRELRSLNSGIRVCAISPGFVETEFAEVMTGDPAAAQALYSRFKCLSAADVAQSVGWLIDTPEHMQVHDILMRPTQQVS